MTNKAKEHIEFHCLFTGVYFNSFGSVYIPQQVLDKIRDKSMKHNIFEIQSDDSTMCRLYCIPFIEYMFAEKTLLNYTNLSSPND